jgi:hypothetical protein
VGGCPRQDATRTPQCVKGDFAQGKVVLHGATYLKYRDNNYYITELI